MSWVLKEKLIRQARVRSQESRGKRNGLGGRKAPRTVRPRMHVGGEGDEVKKVDRIHTPAVRGGQELVHPGGNSPRGFSMYTTYL